MVFGRVPGICSALSWQGEESKCGLPLLVNFGDGCCLLARCYVGDVCYDFAALPGEVKIKVAQRLKKEKKNELCKRQKKEVDQKTQQEGQRFVCLQIQSKTN
jgi:hypothetical protein